MATRSSILSQRIPMDRGTWWATVQGGRKEMDTTEQLSPAQHSTAHGVGEGRCIKSMKASLLCISDYLHRAFIFS